MMLRRWKHDARNLAEAGIQPSPFKILLKTKDDYWLLQRWIDHHGSIIGPENLIIFDNMSTDPAVLSIYAGLGDDVPVFQFSEQVDCVHITTIYAGLYQELRALCDHFVFLDTDEYLKGLADPRHFLPDRALAGVIGNMFADAPDFVPCTWLSNVPGHEAAFWVGSEQALVEGMRWGKPVCRSTRVPEGLINHNIQLAMLGAAAGPATSLFVLHYNHLFPRQRIMSSLNKLKSFNHLPATATVDDALGLELGSDQPANGNPAQWLKEIKTLSKFGTSYPDHLTGQSHPHLLIEGDNISYSNPAAEQLVSRFLDNPAFFQSSAGLATVKRTDAECVIDVNPG